jgi:hypothetical protein
VPLGQHPRLWALSSPVARPHVGHTFSWPEWAVPSTWWGMTGDWEKTHKDKYIEKLGPGVSTSPDERCWWHPPPPSALIYTACMGKWGEMQVNFSWVQWHRLQEQHTCGMLLFTTDYPHYISMYCFPCKGVFLNLASLGWVHAYQPKGSLTELCPCQGYFHCFSLPTCNAALLNLAHLLHARALPSQHKGLWHGLAHVKLSSQSN